MRFMLFGAPGVGKGTQAKLLSQKLNIPHISTGDILRQAVKDKTELGNKADEIMSKGELVPDDIMIGIIKNRLQMDDCKIGFILDGYPRTEVQAQAFDNLLQELHINNVMLINISADEEEIVSRLNNRRACRECGQIFVLSDIEGLQKCPNCSAENSFYLRDDDKEEVIRNRLKVFEENTRPVLNHYGNQGKVLSVNGIGAVDDINAEIMKALGKE